MSLGSPGFAGMTKAAAPTYPIRLFPNGPQGAQRIAPYSLPIDAQTAAHYLVFRRKQRADAPWVSMKRTPQKSLKPADLARRYVPDLSGPVPRPAPGPRNVKEEDVRRAVKDLFRQRARHAQA